jgi:hypothetical protein
MGGAGDVPKGRAPRRNVRRAADAGRDDDDDDDGERVLRSGAADAVRLRWGWTGKEVGSDGGNEARDEEWRVGGRRGRL